MPLAFLSRRAPVRVEPFFGFRNADRLTLTARALRARAASFGARGFWRGFATMLEQYASHEIAGLSVELEYSGPDGAVLHSAQVSDAEGYLHFELDLPPGHPLPETTIWEKAVLRWRLRSGERAEVAAQILAPGTEAKFGVISDVDDTILETGITGSARQIARNWKRVLAQMPSERVEVPGAPEFYAALSGADAPSVRPIFYVSSSPWNLFSYLVAFKRERGFPLGPVMLRDWGLSRATFGSESHGSHKRAGMETILVAYPDLQFALVGDDTQKDLAAFGDIAARFPGRIAAVFIRKASAEPLNAEEERARAIIDDAGIPYWSGSDYRDALTFLTRVGLA